MPEMVNQVCFQVMGCDLTVAMACEAGQLELNVMMPVIAWNALHASTILREAMKVFRLRCIDGITADRQRALELLERSTASATALSPYIGYAATAEIARNREDREVDPELSSSGVVDRRSSTRPLCRVDSAAASCDERRRVGLAVGQVSRVVW